MGGAVWSLKNSFSAVYDLRCQCHKIYNVMKEDFVLHWRNGRVADTFSFNGEYCVVDRVRFLRQSNLTQVTNGSPLLYC